MKTTIPRGVWILATALTLVMLPGFFTVARLRSLLQTDAPGESGALLSGGWQYRWEHPSPHRGPGDAKALWRGTASPFDPPGRIPKGTLHLRRILPAIDCGDPAIYTDLALERFEVFLDDEKIYSFGNPDIAGASFAGWPWHLISLPRGFPGKTIHFRIQSAHTKIGIIGGPLLGERGNLIRRLIASDIDKFVLGFIYLFLGSSLFFVFSGRSEVYNRREVFSLALFSVLMGLFSIAKAGSGVKQFIYDYPAFWSWAEIASLYLMPCCLLTYIMEVIGRNILLRILRALHLAYAVPALAFAATGLVPLSKTILPFQLLFLTAIAVCIVLMVRAVKRAVPESAIIAAGITVLGLFGAYDVMLAIGVVRDSVSFSHIGIFIFILSLYLVMARKVTAITAQIQKNAGELTEANLELESYKNTLEDLVRDRTKELNETLHTVSAMNRELERLSITDMLTGVYNRRQMERLLAAEWLRLSRERLPLSLLMIDIDHFKPYNDEFGHQEGDTVLAETAGVLASALKRPGDALARYGGEEFLAILPNTDAGGAAAIAEAMRAAVESLAAKNPGVFRRTVTISVGVASEVPDGTRGFEAMISRVDAALYTAKTAGRNRVISFLSRQK